MLSVLVFSSFSTPTQKDIIKVEKSSKKEKKKEIKLIEFEAMVSATSLFVPIQYVNALIKTFTLVENEWFENYFEPTSQAFHRIFFTHIISKNAP